ncbi:MAG: 3-deoxy-D-manno-octulosonate 8-phosphate phosphatase [Bacteroidales bacterium]|nr:3-deoxy-D-manno-octulosonate 8-phosphate phosphatase [Bacteroidales bacterium]
MIDIRKKMHDITAMVFDYDGVLTDGTILLTPDGDGLRTAYVRDGYALQLAAKKGLHVAIISGGRSPSITRRIEALKIRDLFLGVEDKLSVFQEYITRIQADPAHVLYMGDDIPDYRPMKAAGFPCCPADAAEEIRAVSMYISPFPGGRGCARDVIEQVLKLQGKWMHDDGFLW